jgi:hypothetical protein
MYASRRTRLALRRRHSLAVMAHAGHVYYPPGTSGPQCRRGRVPGSDVVMRALIAGGTLSHGTRPFWEKASRGLHVRSARHYRDKEAEQRPQCISIDIRLTETKGPGRCQIRHRVGACIGTDSDSHTVAETERKHSMDERSYSSREVWMAALAAATGRRNTSTPTRKPGRPRSELVRHPRFPRRGYRLPRKGIRSLLQLGLAAQAG